jgi:photosynthetic reaction center cytochrome c subunit
MRKSNIGHSCRGAALGLAAAFLSFPALHAAQVPGLQNAQAATPQAEPAAETVFKNIQALKGMPASQMKPIMNLISTSVGMKCDQCHDTDAYEKDDKRAKQTTRQMIKLTLDVNKIGFEGQTQVSCYSCHRGRERPVAMPPLGQASMPAPAPRPVTTGLPTYDQIIEKYAGAVGSAASFEKFKSRIMKGSRINPAGTAFPVVIYQAAPDKMAVIATTPDGISAQGFNGSVGWTSAPKLQSDMNGAELAQFKRAAAIARPLKIKEESLTPRVMARVMVGDKEAYQVSARADGQRVQLYFEVQSGMLLRRVVLNSTLLGSFPEQTDFDDYREVDGVKLPFLTRYSTSDPAAGYTLELKEILHNVPIEDARFNPPVIQK